MTILLAGRMFQKMRGLLFTKPHDAILLIMPCCDIHTIGMRYCLDVAFVDAAGFVMESHRSVSPFCRLRCSGAAAVLERFANQDSLWFEKGDRIGIVRMEGVVHENMSDMRSGGI